EKVQGYDELIASIEENDIAAVSNPGFELFLLLHVDGSYEKYIQQYLILTQKYRDGLKKYLKDIL
ncbi:MAG TPA: RloB family protein, partial [Candidatus Mediterraneibacter stercoripullorum]|nr:RloB family protein [Candidatus Mediterraneibacter stercoripullorum]